MNTEMPDESKDIVIHANYEIFVFLLVIFSMVNTIFLILPTQADTKNVIRIVDAFISTFLLADFFFRLYWVNNKRRYLIEYYGFLDFIGSLPLPGLRMARLIRTMLVVRKLRRSDLHAMQQVVVEKRAQSALLIISLLSIIVMEVSSIAMLNAENGAPNANIKTASDALWWGYVTIATVGYGDKYPVTNQGRIVGLFVMTAGVGLFSVLTSFLADWFRRPRRARRERRVLLPGSSSIESRARVQEMKRLIEEHEAVYQQSILDLKAKLAEIENYLP